MRKTVRGIALLMCIAMLLGMLPVISLAADSPAPVIVPQASEEAIDPSIPIYENPQYSFAERAADLVARMSVEQKGSQAVSDAPAINASALGGGALNTKATKNIPAYQWWSECLHGYSYNNSRVGNFSDATSYPQNASIGNTWNPDLYYQEAVMISDEIRERAAKNSQTGNCINLNFYSPTVNMHRDPRWGRNEESYSEDVLLNSTMASAFVKGIEGKDQDGNLLDPDGYKKAIATVKHYVANNSERNRLNGGASSSLRALREYYTAPYRNVIQEADVTSLMTAYSTFNGEPSSYSSYLMDTLLRQTFGFSGHITSDCDSVATEQRHSYQNPFTGTTMTDIEALAGSMAHGEDLECSGGYGGFGTYRSKISRMVESEPQTDKGKFTENALDIAVHRLMTARISTGEFDANLRYTQEASARQSAQNATGRAIPNQTVERLEMNDAVTKEAVVMLQNKGVLPLQIPATGSDYSVVVVGAWQTNMYKGLYTSGNSNSTNEVNIQRGIREAIQRVNPNVKLTYITSNSLTDANRTAISAANAVIVVTGTPESYSKEDGDRTSTILPDNQETLITNVGRLNPNTVVIMETCGPMRVNTWADDVNAILWSSFGGIRKGTGFGCVITGEVNPSGKTTDTWYQTVNDSGASDIPSIYDYELFPSGNKNGRTYMYYNGANKPSYPFGFGLSYTTFEYSNLKLDKTAYDANDTIKVSFDVKNTGSVAGKETTQLYIAQPDAPAELQRPIKRLEGFKKIELQPGETKTVELEVEIPDLAFYNEADDCYKVDTGKYQVQVGTNSAEANLTRDITVSGEMREYPVLLTVKANQRGDSENGIEERLIYDKNQYVNPQLTVCMSNEKLYGYIIAQQKSPIKSLKSTPLPEGMTFTYESNRPSVVKIEGDKIKTVGAGVATVTVTGTLGSDVVTADFVVYVEGNSYLENITLDGEPLAGFNREKHGYELSAANFNKAPVVAAVNEDPDLQVTVTQFTGIPGVATVVAECVSTNQRDVYRIGIGAEPVATDFSKGWAAAQAKNWTVLNGDGSASFGAGGLIINGQAGTIAAGTAKNVYTEPGFGEWVAQTKLNLGAAIASGQQAGIVVMDTAENNVQFVYESAGLTAYSYVDGTRTQVGRASIGSVTELSLQVVKQGAKYSFRYSTDGDTWNVLSGTATVVMGYPQVGVLATGNNLTATFDGINVFKVSQLYPRLSGITVDGVALSEFDPELFTYSCEVDADGTAIPVVAAAADDEDLRIEIEQASERFGTARINVFSEASSAAYSIRFNHGPVSDYFADGSFSEVWEVLREDDSAYSVEKGKGIVMPTQQADIYSTGAAWKNCFVAPAMGNWQVVAKVIYPTVPTANYQQAMLLVWQDEDNYIRMNCQQSQLRMEPGVETAGSFNGNLGSGNATAAADGTVTLYFLIEKNGNDYSVGYSQDGTSFETLGTARGIVYDNPQIGLFATQNSSSTPIDTYFEYAVVTWRNGVRQMDYADMLKWAAQNAADYIAADLPAETSGDLALSAAPHGYTVTLNSSDESVISPEGKVTPAAEGKNVQVSVTVTEGAASATSEEVNIAVRGANGELPPPPVLDTAALQQAIQDAEGLDLSKYTDESAAALTEALASAKKALAEASTQSAVDKAKADLDAAKAALVEKPIPVNYDALNAAIADAEKVEKDKYTDESVAAFEAALAAAKEALKADNQAAVDKAKADLDAAKAALVERPPVIDKAALQAAIAAAEKLDVSGYTDESVAAFNKALADAKAALDADTQAAVDKAAADLTAAVSGLTPKPPFRFDDVQDPGQYYYAPVYWAVDQGITTGTTPTTFSPGSGCTRAQVVTFLWRAKGKPEPTSTNNPFEDVAADQYYYKAVLWAVEKGITSYAYSQGTQGLRV